MINWSHLAELRSDLGDETFAEVVNMFLQEVQTGINGLTDNRTAEDLTAKFHMLKGSALSLGLTDLANVCATAEGLARKGKQDCFRREELCKVFQSSRNELFIHIPALAS